MHPCDDPEIWPPLAVSYFSLTTTLLFCAAIAVGHIFVILAVLKDPYKRLRNPFSCLLVNSSISDLIVGILSEPIRVVFYVMEINREEKYTFIEWKDINVLCFRICVTSSIFSLAALSLERYAAVVHAVKYRQRMTYRKSAVVIVLIWAASFLLNFLCFILGGENWEWILYITFATTAICLTMAIFVFTYIRIFRTLKRRKDLKSQMGVGNNFAANREKTKGPRTEESTIQFLLIIYSCYITVMFPVLVITYALFFNISEECKLWHALRDVRVFLMSLLVAINPFVCFMRLKHFRRAIRKIARGRSTCKYDVTNPDQPHGNSCFITVGRPAWS